MESLNPVRFGHDATQGVPSNTPVAVNPLKVLCAVYAASADNCNDLVEWLTRPYDKIKLLNHRAASICIEFNCRKRSHGSNCSSEGEKFLMSDLYKLCQTVGIIRLKAAIAGA
jgi:hypothetical protein